MIFRFKGVELNRWSIFYPRPDGWWEAGRGFKSIEHAVDCAREQLPGHVTWRVAKTQGRKVSKAVFLNWPEGVEFTSK